MPVLLDEGDWFEGEGGDGGEEVSEGGGAHADGEGVERHGAECTLEKRRRSVSESLGERILGFWKVAGVKGGRFGLW